jgi:hypothetical protein
MGAQDARQAVKTGYMRRILVTSIALAVIGMLATWLWIARPGTGASQSVHNAGPGPSNAGSGQVIPQQDMSSAPGAPSHVTPQANQPQPQD